VQQPVDQSLCPEGSEYPVLERLYAKCDGGCYGQGSQRAHARVLDGPKAARAGDRGAGLKMTIVLSDKCMACDGLDEVGMMGPGFRKMFVNGRKVGRRGGGKGKT